MGGPTTPSTVELSPGFVDLGVLAVLDELVQVCQPIVDVLHGGDDGVSDGSFVVGDAVLLGKLYVKTTDSHGGEVKPTIYFFLKIN